MARIYVPNILNERNFTDAELKQREAFEKSCIDYAIELNKHTTDEELQYTIHKYQFYHRWTPAHFELIKEYNRLIREYDSLLAEMLNDPTIYATDEYKKRVSSMKKIINLVQQGLKISSAIKDMADGYEREMEKYE
ncbi:hypothetical protein [Neobacillus sp. Marseille-QA0830]